jgi:hypothetical protein
MVIDEVGLLNDHRATVRGHLGGALQTLLEQELIRPSLNRTTLKFEHITSERILDRLAEAGILERTVVDRIRVCPSCGGLPVYRSVCHTCRSSLIMTDELIHHFACAHVASVDQFRDGIILRCPKCQMSPLIVGADFEYLPGLHTCLGCSRVGSQLQMRAECMLCQHDFLAEDSAALDLVGFRPIRFER